MKKITTLVLFAIGAVALPASSSQTYCEHIYEYAYKVMTKRQKNLPIVEVIKSAKNSVEKGVVIDAYEMVLFNSNSMKQKYSKQFANEKAAECYKK